MIQTFEFQPPGTVWFGCEFDVDFDCESLVLDSDDPKVRPTKCPAVGFVISHEYTVISAHIENVKQRPASIPGCPDARHYDFTLRYRMQEKIGLGFNLGAGTGTLGWGLRPRTLRLDFSTDPICCSETAQPATRDRGHCLSLGRVPEFGALASALILLGLAALYQMLDGADAQRAYSGAIAMAILFAAIMTVQRRLLGAGASRDEESKENTLKS